MKLALATPEGQSGKTIDVPAMFGREFNKSLVHQVIVALMNGQRAGTKKQKTRAEVRGGGIKPWKQKGTGRARAGTIRSPLWRSGGIVFAAVPRSFKQKVNKKMYHGAMTSILSELIRQDRMKVVSEFQIEGPKTKYLLEKLKAYDMSNVLIVVEHVEENLYLAARNLPHVAVKEPVAVSPVQLLKFDHVLITADALKKFEEVLK